MKKLSYVTLLSTPSYLMGVIVLYRSLRRFTNKPFLCVCSMGLDEACINKLHQEGIETYRLEKSALDGITDLPTHKGLEHWKYTFDKLFIWDLVDYDKIVFLDSDMMICKNIDELFDKEDLSGVQAGRFLISSWIRLNSGLMVIKPNNSITKALLEHIKPTIIKRIGGGTALVIKMLLTAISANGLMKRACIFQKNIMYSL